MLTPLDIQNKEFKKGMRGYKESDVDSFLDEVITDYERIYKDNIELKEKMSMISDQLKHYNDIEETLQNTLIVAQSAAEEVRVNAREKSNIIIKEAEENARKIISKANDEVVDIKREYESVKKDISIFKTRFKSFLQSQLEAANYIENDRIGE